MDISRSQGRHKKRNVCVFRSTINPTEMPTAGTYELGILPKNIVITNAFLAVKTPMDATRTVDVGFSGGATVLDDAALTGLAGSVVSTGFAAQLVETGPTLTVVTSGALTQGECELLVEYVEYEQCTGELTDFVG